MKFSEIFLFIVVLFLINSEYVNAQKSSINGWFFSSHEQGITKKWALLSDIQIRSANHYKYIETVLLRPAIKYDLNDRYSAALGYAYLGNWDREKGENSFEHEHRVWQQFTIDGKLGRAAITNRARLEQRFLEQDGAALFSQRLRYYIRVQMPFVKTKNFKRGAFAGLQNEIFLNIQNKKHVNNRLFDQNRALAALGYRFSEGLDVEAGYLYRYQIEEEKTNNHIFQLTVTTKL